MKKLEAIKPEYSKDLADLPDEIWVDVIGYDGIYQISNKARVKSLAIEYVTNLGSIGIRKEKIKSLKWRKDKPYLLVEYTVDKVSKRYNFAKQMALHFIPDYKPNAPIYWKDGNRFNCQLENLIPVTEKNVIELYDNKEIIPPNEVSEMLHNMGYKKCSICKRIKKHKAFSKIKRNRQVNNNCQACTTILCRKYRDKK